jgi:hypothetical protein
LAENAESASRVEGGSIYLTQQSARGMGVARDLQPIKGRTTGANS